MPTNRREVIDELIEQAINNALPATSEGMRIIDITKIVWSAEGQVAMIGVPRPPAAR